MIIERSIPMKMLEIQTVIRRPIVVDIEIYNPEKFDVVFDVVTAGDGLKGEKIFVVEAKSSRTYELMYLPVKVGRYMGMITFLNEMLGEIWYEIGMSAQSDTEIRVPLMSAELGKFSTCEVQVDNPTELEVALNYLLSNPTNFDVFPKDIKLKPYESAKI